MSNNVECPYCEAELEVCQDDGFATDESETYEQECHNCGKLFALQVAIHWDFNGHKAECMNGGAHNLVEIMSTGPWHIGYKYCKDCCNKILIDEDANKKAVENYAKKWADR
jgi:transcription elongation factor Elf1